MTMHFFHPRLVTLKRYVDAELPETRRARIAAHVLVCGRCRSDVAFLEALKNTARNLPAPAAPPRILADVLAARDGGDRALLPFAGDEAPRRRAAWRPVLTAAATLAVAWGGYTMIGRWRADDHSISSLEEACMNPSRAAAAGAALFLSVACASEPGLFVAAPEEAGGYQGSSLAVDGTRQQPARWTYRISSEYAGKTNCCGERSLTLLHAEFGGRPAWLTVRERDAQFGGSVVDSSYLDFRTLVPLYQVTYSPYAGQTQMFQYRGDSVVGFLGPAGPTRQPFARALPRDGREQRSPADWEFVVVQVLGSAALVPDWSGRLGGRDFRVTGSATVTVPAGTFDCWRIEAGEAWQQTHWRQTYWVSKDRQWIVRAELATGEPAGSRWYWKGITELVRGETVE